MTFDKRNPKRYRSFMDSNTTVIKVMLASSEIPKVEELKFPLFASAKLDGIRCAVVSGKAMSRKMIPIPNEFVQAWAKENAEALEGLDGELIVGEPCGDGVFIRSGKGVGTVGGEPDFTFYVFECWNQPTMMAVERYAYLESRVQNLPRCVLVPQSIVNTPEELLAYNRDALEQGYEGMILKKLWGHYKYGRSTLNEGLLLKWKEFSDSEAVILEVLQGKTNTNPDIRDALGHAKRSTAKAGKVGTQMVGSFRVKDIHSGVEFKCALGNQTVKEAEQLWAIREQLVGKTIVYKFQKVGVKDKPRFPGLKGFRDAFDII